MAVHPRQPTASARARQAPSPTAAATQTSTVGAAASDPSTSNPSASDLGDERVAKALARAGVASRREVERLIAEGRVALNGRVLTTPAVKVAPGDVLSVDGRPVGAAEPTRLWRYHKPSGLITSTHDPQGRPSVFDALPPGLPRVISIGRLDLNSEGLLLLTNDGALSRALELPSSGWLRRYRVRAHGRITQAGLDTLKAGVTVEGVVYGPIEARLDKVQRRAGEDGDAPANVWISVALSEGKNREVRRVLESLGLRVNRLVRLAYGPFALATLAQGAVEEVGPRVIRELLGDMIAPQNLPTGAQVQSAPPTGQAQAGAGRRTASSPAGVAGAGVKPAEVSAKKTYRPGWARPKIAKPVHATGRARPHRARLQANGKGKPPAAGEAAPYRATLGPRTAAGRKPSSAGRAVSGGEAIHGKTGQNSKTGQASKIGRATKTAPRAKTPQHGRAEAAKPAGRPSSPASARPRSPGGVAKGPTHGAPAKRPPHRRPPQG